MKNEKLQGQNVSRETRRYSWEVICYAPKEDVLKVISKYEDMSHYLLVTHDRDKLEQRRPVYRYTTEKRTQLI